DLASRGSATVGGTIATNAGGMYVGRYGPTRAQVVGIEAVLADGSIVSRMGGLLKDNTGYDLAGLFCGSEGTLAVVTRARLRLVPALPRRAVAVVGLGRLLRLLVGPGRLAQGALTAATAAFWLLLAHALLLGDDAAWRRPALPTGVPGIVGGDDPGGNARATLEVARWLTAQPHAGPIVDCAPNPVWLLAYEDTRFTHPTDCGAIVARPRPDAWVIASSHNEFRGPRTPRPEVLLATGAWRVAGGWDPAFERAIPADGHTFTRSAVVVLEPVPATAGTTPPPVTGTR
ncbi:MAG: FAD-binding oxidoreductase, partial [Myxococcota bacterium]